MKQTTILAIDPGFDRVGWAVGTSSSSFKTSILGYGCIQTKKSQPIFDRYTSLSGQLKKVLHDYKPTELAIENIYFARNTSTALRVSEARGLIIANCLEHKLKVAEYNPNQIKLAVTGHGRASKAAMEKMIRLQFSLPKQEKIIDDTIDALGILLTHAVTRKTSSAQELL